MKFTRFKQQQNYSQRLISNLNQIDYNNNSKLTEAYVGTVTQNQINSCLCWWRKKMDFVVISNSPKTIQ